MATSPENFTPGTRRNSWLAGCLDAAAHIQYIRRERSLAIRLNVPDPAVADALHKALGGTLRGNRIELRSKRGVLRLLKLWRRWTQLGHQPQLLAAVTFMEERAKWRPWGATNPAPAALNEAERLYLLEAGNRTRPTTREV